MGQSALAGDGGDSDYDDDELPTPRTRGVRENAQFAVRCPEGGCDMYAKIPRELHGGWKFQRVCNESRLKYCVGCGIEIDQQACRYCCREHHIALCIDCAREQLGLPEIQTAAGKLAKIEPGDMLLTLGNTGLMIHHCVLARSDLLIEPLPPRERAWFELEPGVQVLGLDVIESSSEEKGISTHWVYRTIYFVRNIATGDTRVIGSYLEEHDKFEINEERMKFKVLLNPVRSSVGGPGLNRALFMRIVDQSAEDSHPWTPNAGLAGHILAKHGIFRKEDFDTTKKREDLVNQIIESRDEAGVCTSVPVICWQDYFLHKHADSVDDAAQMILQYMPICAVRAAPSQIVIELTKRGWVVQENFEPGLL